MVDAPTFLAGKTRTGKTFRAYRLFESHDGPAIFCDIQWSRLGKADVSATSAKEVVAALHDHRSGEPWPHIAWLLDNYDELEDLVDYLKGVHRERHLRGQPTPSLAVFIDEAWRVAPVWADARNPAVRVFTEGFQHRIIGVAITQWPAQTSRLIGGNAYDWYLFALHPKDQLSIERDYRMPPPDWGWIANVADHHYWRYNGSWFQGDAGGVEVEVPEVRGGDTAADVPAVAGQGEPAMGVQGNVPVPDLQDDVPPGPPGNGPRGRGK